MDKIRTKPFPAQITVGQEEMKAVERVMKTGVLSHYRGNYSKNFMGGPEVQAFEEEFADYIGSKYAIAVNSCTSALQIACGALQVVEGDEVIVSPWSMSCSASAPLVWGARPVFVDIEEDYYCVDLDKIRKYVDNSDADFYPKTVIAVSLFGQPFDPNIREWADAEGIHMIEDTAQAIGSTCLEKKAGTLGHVGCFSFTQGKHITAGEGGMIVTDNENIALACRMIRNHAEAVLHDIDKKEAKTSNEQWANSHPNMIGYNMRMTEIAAAILREQLKKLDSFVEMRRRNATMFDLLLSSHGDRFQPPMTRAGCSHSYYVYAFKILGSSHQENKRFVEKLNSLLPGEEGRPDKRMFNLGYIDALDRFPLFTDENSKRINRTGKQPNCDRLNKCLVTTTMVGLPLTPEDFEAIERAFDTATKEVLS